MYLLSVSRNEISQVFFFSSAFENCILQGMVDGSASTPALRQDTGYMVEKTYPDIAPDLGAFGAYVMPQ